MTIGNQPLGKLGLSYPPPHCAPLSARTEGLLKVSPLPMSPSPTGGSILYVRVRCRIHDILSLRDAVEVRWIETERTLLTPALRAPLRTHRGAP